MAKKIGLVYCERSQAPFRAAKREPGTEPACPDRREQRAPPQFVRRIALRFNAKPVECRSRCACASEITTPCSGPQFRSRRP